MLQTFPRRRFNFREVIRHVDVERRVKRLAEPMDLSKAKNPKVDLNYFNILIPMILSDKEKTERLSEVADAVLEIENSDVILLGMWVSPKA
jgi:hypothetical protein